MNTTGTPNMIKEKCSFAFNFTGIDFASKHVFLNNVLLCLTNVFLSVSTIFLNSIIVIAYWKSTQLKKKKAYFLIMVLSLPDLAVGAVCAPLNALMKAIEIIPDNDIPCQLYTVEQLLNLVFSGCSFKTLVVMSIERYLGIIHPIYHRTKVTKGRLFKCSLIFWLAAVVLTAFIFYHEDVLIKFITGEVFLCIAALVYIYVKIYFVSTKSLKNTANGINGSKASNSDRKLYIAKLKLAKTSFTVVVCFLICFFPMAALTASSVSSSTIDQETAYILINWAASLLLLNSSLNSLIFFWKNIPLRKEALKILKHV